MAFFGIKNILRLLKRAGIWILKTLCGFVLIYILVIALSVALLQQFAPSLPERAILVIDVERGWVETPIQRSPLLDLFQMSDFLPGAGMPHSLLQTIEAIQTAQDDSRIAGLLVVGDLAQARVDRIGLSGILELGDAIQAFGQSKPTYAFMKNPGMSDLLLAAHCEHRKVSPHGDVVFPGIATEVLFFAETFETIGVGVQVAREGTHKSAVEPYLRTAFSPEAKAQQERLTGTLWSAYLESLAEAAGIERTALQNWAETRGILQPETLAETGFGKVQAFADLLTELTDVAGPDENSVDTFSQVDVAHYLAHGSPEDSDDASESTERDAPANVAVVFVEGVIANEDTGAITDGERIARQIREARKSGEYEALLLRVNSPGGAVYPSRVIAHEMKLARASMPVFVSMGQYAASGGYWVAAPGERISATPLTLTGSIGVFAVLFNLEDSARKLGLRFERTESAKMANLFSVTAQKSPEQMGAIQSLVSKTYEDFLKHVSKSRGLSSEVTKDASEGQVWTGDEALERNLLDTNAGFLGLRRDIAERLGVERLEFDFYGREAPALVNSLFPWMQSRLPLREFREAGETLEQLSRYRGPLSYSPVRIR